MQLSYFWPQVSVNAVCLSQDLIVSDTTPTFVNINGSLSTVLAGGNVVDFKQLGYSRTLSVTVKTSGAQPDGIYALLSEFYSLTIFGTQNNVATSLIVGGGQPGSMSWPPYDENGVIIVSLAAFGTVNTIVFQPIPSLTELPLPIPLTITVGTAKNGYFNAIDIGNNVNVSSHVYSLSFRVNGCTYTIYESLDESLNDNYDDLIDNKTFMLPESIQPNHVTNVSKLMQLSDVCSYLLIQVASNNDSDTLALDFLSLQ